MEVWLLANSARGQVKNTCLGVSPLILARPLQACLLPGLQINVHLPAALKEVLVNEHEAFKKGLRLPPIPRKPSVMDILNEYVRECQAPGPSVSPEEKASS